MFRLKIALGICLCCALVSAQQPPVRVNVLNVCTPSAEEQKELSSALVRIPAKPAFGVDYEVARGRSTLNPGAQIPGMESMPTSTGSTANWVRVRHEFIDSSEFSNAQYSFSTDASNMVETLVFHIREPKDLVQISIEDSASAVTTPTAMLSSNTPVSRVKLERFGKPSVVLARCSGSDGGPAVDQSSYEPIFRTASSVMSRYRSSLRVRSMVPEELTRLTSKTGGSGKTNGKKVQ